MQHILCTVVNYRECNINSLHNIITGTILESYDDIWPFELQSLISSLRISNFWPGVMSSKLMRVQTTCKEQVFVFLATSLRLIRVFKRLVGYSF